MLSEDDAARIDVPRTKIQYVDMRGQALENNTSILKKSAVNSDGYETYIA